MTAYGKQQAQVPGIIIMWSGTISSIPTGWIICDGTNGTPDLRDKFVKCVPNDSTDPGTTGGESTHILTTGEMPVHNHGVNDPGHVHPDKFGIDFSTVFPRISNQTGVATTDPIFKSLPSGDGNNTLSLASSSATANITIEDTGVGSAHENEPVFFKIIYIQKV